MGAVFAKGLTLKMGQTHVHKYLRPLLARIEPGDVDPAFVITHHLRLASVPYGYKSFRDKAMIGQPEAHSYHPITC
jgi:threonine dehydrogenase-like Zn-dependent dehydrogenase